MKYSLLSCKEAEAALVTGWVLRSLQGNTSAATSWIIDPTALHQPRFPPAFLSPVNIDKIVFPLNVFLS